MTPIILMAGLLSCDTGSCGSYLYQPAYCLDHVHRGPARPYQPQPGDIVLATDDKFFWKITHNLAGTGHPHHTGVVFERPDGSMAVLEAGPYDTIRIRILDAVPHLQCYESKGLVWVRQRRCPLTPEQSRRLTEFAMQQDGKFFALGRLAKQLTIFRPRGPIRTAWFGGPHGNRRSFYCSELALEALVAACALDPETTRPAATYPRDIFFDRSPNPYINRHLKLCDRWYPPALFTSCPTSVCEESTPAAGVGEAKP